MAGFDQPPIDRRQPGAQSATNPYVMTPMSAFDVAAPTAMASATSASMRFTAWRLLNQALPNRSLLIPADIIAASRTGDRRSLIRPSGISCSSASLLPASKAPSHTQRPKE